MDVSLMVPLLLICHPEPNYSLSFHGLLDRCGIDVMHVRDGKECLEAVQKQAPSFLLLSENTDGGELQKVLHGINCSNDRQPIVFVTGKAPRWVLSEKWEMPLKRCVSEPVPEAPFVEMLVTLHTEQSAAARKSERHEDNALHARPDSRAMVYSMAHLDSHMATD